ncbi:MAG: restriction endonuclease subunit S [Treponema sp.]|nr:restriction endonuclease subunit S [Treponema sp.]
MTAKDLKNALLQEAVQGKLVPQIASEGNASDLLQEIRKERLSHGFANSYGICDGKNKKTKSSDLRSKSQIRVTKKELSEITEDEIPFEIPESWCWCRLGELGLYRKGPFGSSLTKSMFVPKSDDSIKVYEQKNAIQKDYSLGEYYISKKKFETMQSFIVEPSDIIVSCAGTIGEVYKLPNDAPIGIINQALMRVKLFNDNLSAFWMMYFDYVLKKEASKQGAGTAIKNIPPFEILKAYPFPLPPLAEQKRIVAAIEKFMPLIEEYGKKESALKAINEQIGALTKKAILQEAVHGKLVPQIAAEGNAKDLLEEIRKEKLSHGFANSYGICNGKNKKTKSSDLRSKSQIRVTKKELPEITEDEIPFDIPENWCWCRLGEICNLYTGDSINETEKKLKYTNVKEGWFYIGTKDVNFDQTINYNNGIKIPFEKDTFRIAPKNTVLMCVEGGSAGRKIAFTNQDVCFGNKLCCFNPYNNEIEKFLFYFLQSTLFTAAFKNNINGIIGGVSINNLKRMLFPLPPLAEQKRIVVAIEKMLPLCEKLGE